IEPIKVSFIRLRCLLFKAYISGNMGGVKGELYKEQRSGHLLTWGPKSGARQRALWILSLEHRSSLTALGVRLGSGVTHVLGWHGNSGRDREEGTIIQLLQPQVPGKE
ncbi:mCG1041449, partial [Mus musculus]